MLAVGAEGEVGGLQRGAVFGALVGGVVALPVQLLARLSEIGQHLGVVRRLGAELLDAALVGVLLLGERIEPCAQFAYFALPNAARGG